MKTLESSTVVPVSTSVSINFLIMNSFKSNTADTIALLNLVAWLDTRQG